MGHNIQLGSGLGDLGKALKFVCGLSFNNNSTNNFCELKIHPLLYQSCEKKNFVLEK